MLQRSGNVRHQFRYGVRQQELNTGSEPLLELALERMVGGGSELVLARSNRKHLRKRAQCLADGPIKTRVRDRDVRVTGCLGVYVRIQQGAKRQITGVHLVDISQPGDLVGCPGADIGEFEHSSAGQFVLDIETPVLRDRHPPGIVANYRAHVVVIAESRIQERRARPVGRHAVVKQECRGVSVVQGVEILCGRETLVIVQ